MKSHPFFKSVTWALLRHSVPPIVPTIRSEDDTINFRHLTESNSFDLEKDVRLVSSSLEQVVEESGDLSNGSKQKRKMDPFSNFSSGAIFMLSYNLLDVILFFFMISINGWFVFYI